MSHRVVTPWREIAAPRSARLGTPGGITTSRPPLASAPQISRVEASKEREASCSRVWPRPRSAKPGSLTSRTTARCGTATPFGRPVEPEVYIT